MSKRFVIQPGTICTFDPANAYKQNQYGVIIVEVCKLYKKRYLHNSSEWVVRDIENLENEFIAPEFMLFPNGMTVIRNPIDIPRFNSIDIKLIEKIIEGFSNENDLTLTNKEYNRLKAVNEKIKFAMSLTEV